MTLQLCLGQTNLIQTNIDQSYLKPKWMDNYLKTSVFRDGTELVISYDIANWGKNNSPTVFITKNNDFLYNHNAIMENKGICPIGYKVPDFIEVSNSKIDIVRSKNYIQNDESSESNRIRSTSSILHFLDDYIYSSPSKEIYLATSTTSESMYEFTSAIINLDSKIVEDWPLSNNSGVAIKCIEDFNESLKTKEVAYNILLPNQFSKLKNTLTDLMINFKTKNFNFTGTLRFDANGKNVSDGFGVVDNRENQSLYNSIKNAILNWSVYPYYNDIRVMSKAPINLKIIRYKEEKSKFTSLSNQKIYDLKLNNLSDTKLFNRVRNCADNDFKFNYKSVYYKIEFNGNLENEPKINLLNKVKGKGPIYSLLSVVPGLGQLKIKQQDGYRKLRLWHFSVPIGAIAIASKIYSNYCYSKYLNNLDGTGSRKYYTNANFSQKVFLSSLLAYSAMSLVDFTFTFGIGCKNKITQMKVNSLIRDLK